MNHTPRFVVTLVTMFLSFACAREVECSTSTRHVLSLRSDLPCPSSSDVAEEAGGRISVSDDTSPYATIKALPPRLLCWYRLSGERASPPCLDARKSFATIGRTSRMRLLELAHRTGHDSYEDYRVGGYSTEDDYLESESDVTSEYKLSCDDEGALYGTVIVRPSTNEECPSAAATSGDWERFKDESASIGEFVGQDSYPGRTTCSYIFSATYTCTRGGLGKIPGIAP